MCVSNRMSRTEDRGGGRRPLRWVTVRVLLPLAVVWLGLTDVLDMFAPQLAQRLFPIDEAEWSWKVVMFGDYCCILIAPLIVPRAWATRSHAARACVVIYVAAILGWGICFVRGMARL